DRSRNDDHPVVKGRSRESIALGAVRSVPSQFQRRGTIYLLVMVAAILLSIIGFSLLTTSRLAARVRSQSDDIDQAEQLAESAVEFALSKLAANNSWRTTYTSGVEAGTVSFGAGTISFKLVNEGLGLAPGAGN